MQSNVAVSVIGPDVQRKRFLSHYGDGCLQRTCQFAEEPLRVIISFHSKDLSFATKMDHRSTRDVGTSDF